MRRLAAELKLAVVVVHHLRKMDSDDPFDTVSGTLGLTGSADNVLILDRTSNGTILYFAGVTWKKTTGRWSILGEASEVRKSDQRKAIIEALRDGELSVTQLVAVTHMKREPLLHQRHIVRWFSDWPQESGQGCEPKLPTPSIRLT